MFEFFSNGGGRGGGSGHNHQQHDFSQRYLDFYLLACSKPNIISLTYPTHTNLQIEMALLNVIRDLVQRSPRIMVITGGTNTGVMKLVGKAMKNHILTRGNIQMAEDGKKTDKQ